MEHALYRPGLNWERRPVETTSTLRLEGRVWSRETGMTWGYEAQHKSVQTPGKILFSRELKKAPARCP